MTADDIAEPSPPRSLRVRLNLALVSVVAAVELVLAVFGGFSWLGRTVAALAAASWALCIYLSRRRPMSRAGRPALYLGSVATCAGVVFALMIHQQSDRPGLPHVSHPDVAKAHQYAVSACVDYYRSLVASGLLGFGTKAPSPTHQELVDRDVQVLDDSTQEARSAAAYDTRWDDLYVALWRIDQRTRGNSDINDDLYEQAGSSMYPQCHPILPGK